MYCTIHGPYGILWFCPLFWWVAIHCLERGWQNWWVFIHLFFCDVDTTLIFRITYNITTYNLPIPGWWFPIFYRCVHPELWRKFPFWRAYVSDGSVQPPRKFRCKHHPRFIPTHREIPPNRKTSLRVVVLPRLTGIWLVENLVVAVPWHTEKKQKPCNIYARWAH